MRWADDFDEIGKAYRELQKHRWGDTQPGEAKANAFEPNPLVCSNCNDYARREGKKPVCLGACDG